ncbi:MAG: peptidase domain-containing ABC transporter, partial [Hyphomicrobiales bacterium]|nr:peptidase domain-containing ABC transporter [Hyphomicrobiales bacterium]
MTALGVVKPQTSEDVAHAPSGIECISLIARHHGLHIPAERITLENHLPGAELSAEEIARCAARLGLKAKRVRLNWGGLSHLKKSLPVIVTLTSGGSMVLEAVQGGEEAPAVALRDPKAGEEVKLLVDRIRF